MRERGSVYPFMISNMGRSDKNRTRWWSILDLHPKKKEIFLFNSFRLKAFIIKDDKKIIIKVLFGTAKFRQTNKALTLVESKFSRTYLEKLSRK